MIDFEELRPRLFGIAYRITGVVADAEDVVQETWIAWNGMGHGEIRTPEAYLTRAVSNRALNRLRDARRRREDYIGPWLPEPLDTARRPDEAAEIADSVSYALMVLLEQLTPLERAAFVLREVFQLPSAEVAAALGSTPQAVRQLSSRARKHVERRDRQREVDRGEHARIADDFIHALAAGDVERATNLLSPNIVLVTDGGGVRKAALRPIEGVEKVMRFLLGLAARYGEFAVSRTELNGEPTLVTRMNDDLTVMHLELDDHGKVGVVWAVRNPSKLTDLPPDLDWQPIGSDG